MSGEMYKYAQVWLTALLCLCYCHSFVGKVTHKGFVRLFCVLPVVCLFLALPLRLHSIHLGGTTAFFLSWLANFKLLLFAFGNGPLSAPLSLPNFVALACLPIKFQQENQIPQKGSNSILNYAIKSVLLAVLIRSNDYSDHIHPKIILFLYCFHMYFCLEITLAAVAGLARVLLRAELEAQFNNPHLSTSLQDFWGRRWNLMVSSILRPTVYEPVRALASRALGRGLAPLPAVMATFAVSAGMHELMFYYLGRATPTWEITCFFLLHGACLAAEIAIKKLIAGRFKLPGIVSGAMTIVFVMLTGFWLFFPQLLRSKCDVRAFEEYAAASAFFKKIAVSVADIIRFRGMTD